MVTSVPVQMLISRPSMPGVRARARKPRAVSVTKLKSRVGVRSPTLISFLPEAIWVMMVGMMARALWRGP